MSAKGLERINLHLARWMEQLTGSLVQGYLFRECCGKEFTEDGFHIKSVHYKHSQIGCVYATLIISGGIICTSVKEGGERKHVLFSITDVLDCKYPDPLTALNILGIHPKGEA